MAFKIYTKSNYFYIVDTDTEKIFEGLTKEVRVRKEFETSESFFFDNVNGFLPSQSINIEDIQDESGTPYADLATFVAFYEANTGNFNAGGATPQLNTDELNAVQGANNPSAENVFATMADIGGGGTAKQEAVYYIGGQDETGFLNVVEKSNNTGVSFSFNRIDVGRIEFINFDPLLYDVIFTSFASARFIWFNNDFETNQIYIDCRDASLAFTDQAFPLGGYITITKV